LSCEDIDGDGRPDFDKDAPIHVEVGLGETDCMLGDDAGDVILFSGPQGGYHVDACFIVEGVPQEVFFVTKITIEPEGIQVAGSDETIDRTGVGLIDWTDKDCSGYYVGARGLIDDLWPTWPTLTEVCEWEGLDVTVEVEIIDYATDRRGYASLVRPAMVMGADGPIDCDAITTGTGTGTGTSTGTTTGTGTGTSTGTTTGTTSTTTGS